MILFSKVVGVSRRETLEIDQVIALVSAFDALDFDGTGDFNLLARAVNDFVDLDSQVFTDLGHQCVEMLACIDRFIFIY